ncbi:MAG: response regulator transcription factor [Chloroflexota bacterium]|nr:response regulator transcription factor [Chloroflexota bacterium]
MRILIVEDEAQLATIVRRVLEQERFEVDLASAGPEGLDAALTGAYDVVILDRMLPGMDGATIVREMRAEGVETPVLMLTALADLPDRVEGLNAGADDYLGKPFAFEELIARLHALVRRIDRPLAPDRIEIGPVAIDLRARSVERDGKPVELSAREFAVLELLARNRGTVLSRDRILERVWGLEAEPQGNVVELYIFYLRRKLGHTAAAPVIRTIRGSGYVLG